MNTIDAEQLRKLFLDGANNLSNNKEYINELNVFPVPDGDTGTNMTLTIMAAASVWLAVTAWNSNGKIRKSTPTAATGRTTKKKCFQRAPPRNMISIPTKAMMIPVDRFSMATTPAESTTTPKSFMNTLGSVISS